jgi:hypothetical protein
VRLGRSVALGLVVAATACRGKSGEPPPAPSESPPKPSAVQPDPGRLPEDPVAGKQSEAQWREHMEEEEHERQIGYDRRYLKEHRAVTKLIAGARARYDGAKTEAAVVKVRADMPGQIAEVKRRVTDIDHWGTNSRLLPDYEALSASLTDAYPAAKIGALKGDGSALDAARAAFDGHMQKITAWLKEAAETEEEREAHEDEERHAK